MKKLRLKRWVKVTLYSVATGIVMLSLLIINSNLENNFISNCEKNNYSHNYCMLHK